MLARSRNYDFAVSILKERRGSASNELINQDKVFEKIQVEIRDKSQSSPSRYIVDIIGWIACIRGCSYGGELARLGGLTRLGEISPTLRNSYKYIMCSYEK